MTRLFFVSAHRTVPFTPTSLKNNDIVLSVLSRMAWDAATVPLPWIRRGQIQLPGFLFSLLMAALSRF
jgi:hypothetical protein